MAKLRDAVGRVRVDGLSRVLAASQGQQEAVATWTVALKKDEAAIDKIHASYAARSLPAPEQEALRQFWAAWVDYRDARVIGDRLNREGRGAEFTELREKRMTPDVANATKALDDLTTASATTASERLSQARDAGQRAVLITALVMALGLLVVIAIGTLVAGSIVRPLHRLRAVLAAVAEGDLTQRAAVTSGDEVGQMAIALNATLGTVHDVIQQIEADAAELSTYATQVAEQSVSGARAQGSGTGGTSGSETTAAQLAQLAGNLNAMIAVFNLEPAYSSPEMTSTRA